MADTVKVSVIVPVYGVERQLPRCVDSLLAQTCPDIEILLVDDGSLDRSGEICDEYAKKDARVRAFHKENGGISSARNHALPFATGEYLLFLDSDDSLEPETIEFCLEKSEGGKYDVVCFGYRHFLEKDDALELIREDPLTPLTLETQKELFARFSALSKAGAFGFVTNKIIRSSTVKDNGVLFDHAFRVIGEDGPFMLALLPYLNNFRIIENCFYNYYHRSAGSVTMAFRDGAFGCYYERLSRTYDFMRKYDCFDKDFLLYTYCSNIFWVYDTMFSESCRLSLGERRKFLKTAFCKPELFDGMNAEALRYAKTTDELTDFSRGSRAALSLILKKRYFLLFILHAAGLLKMKLRGNRT